MDEDLLLQEFYKYLDGWFDKHEITFYSGVVPLTFMEWKKENGYK